MFTLDALGLDTLQCSNVVFAMDNPRLAQESNNKMAFELLVHWGYKQSEPSSRVHAVT